MEHRRVRRSGQLAQDMRRGRFVGLLVSMLTLSGAARKAFLQVGGRS